MLHFFTRRNINLVLVLVLAVTAFIIGITYSGITVLFILLSLLSLFIIIILSRKHSGNEPKGSNSVSHGIHLSELVTQTSDAIISTDKEFNVKSWNPGAETMYGFSEQETLGRRLKDIIKSPLTDEERTRTMEDLNKHSFYQNEFEYSHKNGNKIAVLASFSALRDHIGMITGYVAVHRDITERKQLEKQLKKFNEELEQQVKVKTNEIKKTQDNYFALINSIDGIVWEADAQTFEFNFVSKQAERLLGYPVEKWIKDSGFWSKHIHPDDRNWAIEYCVQCTREKKAHEFEYRMIASNGDIVWLKDFVNVIVENDKPVKLRGIMVDITEWKKSEQTLQASEETTRLIMNSALDAIICMDIRGHITIWTRQAEKIFGWKEEEVIGKTLASTIIPLQYRERHNKGLENYLHTGIGPVLNTLIEITALDKAGREFPIELSITPVKLGDREFFCGFLRDITERKKSEDAVKESEEKYRVLVEHATEVLVVLDVEQQKFVSVNESAVKLFRMSKEELLEVGPLDLSPEFQPDGKTSAEISEEMISRAIAGEKPAYEWTYRDSKGNLIPCEVWLVRLPAENKLLVRGIIVDITERKKAQWQIEKEKLLSDSIINSLPGVFYLFDKNGKYIRWNSYKEIITGYTGEEISRMHPSDFFEGEEKELVIARIAECFTHGETEVEASLVSKSGVRTQFFFTGVSVEYEGKPCLLGMGINITERKLAQEELEKSYRSIRQLTNHLQTIREEERTSIAREIHDELGQQLTVLKMDISWLTNKIKLDDEEVKQKLKNLGEMLDGTVKSVRRISSELRPSLLDDLGLVAAMEWHLKEFEQTSGIKTEFKIPGNDLELSETIKTGIFRIFQESLTNVARHAAAKKVTVSLQRKLGHIVLSIDDNGRGFDKQKTFNKRTLGILGMEERTSMMGGSYKIKSDLGKGTTVLVSVPEQI